MKRFPVALAICAVLASGAARAADMPASALCALGQIYECDGASACELVTPEEISAPRFLRLDLAQKTMHGVGPRAQERFSRVDSLLRKGDIIFAHGIEDEVANERAAMGWLLSLNAGDGGLQLAITGPDVMFIATGECLIDK